MSCSVTARAVNLIGFMGPSGGFGGTLSMTLVEKKSYSTNDACMYITCTVDISAYLVGGGKHHFMSGWWPGKVSAKGLSYRLTFLIDWLLFGPACTELRTFW